MRRVGESLRPLTQPSPRVRGEGRGKRSGAEEGEKAVAGTAHGVMIELTLPSALAYKIATRFADRSRDRKQSSINEEKFMRARIAASWLLGVLLFTTGAAIAQTSASRG